MKKCVNHYLDIDSVTVANYLEDNGWVRSDRSDLLIEEEMTWLQVDAGRKWNGQKINLFSLHIGLETN